MQVLKTVVIHIYITLESLRATQYVVSNSIEILFVNKTVEKSAESPLPDGPCELISSLAPCAALFRPLSVLSPFGPVSPLSSIGPGGSAGPSIPSTGVSILLWPSVNI